MTHDSCPRVVAENDTVTTSCVGLRRDSCPRVVAENDARPRLVHKPNIQGLVRLDALLELVLRKPIHEVVTVLGRI